MDNDTMIKKNRIFGFVEVENENIKADENGNPLPQEIEVMQVGKWNTPNHGSFEVTEKDLDEYVDNFKKGVRKGVPIDLEHKSDAGAVGWVQDLKKVGNSLRATIDWTKTGASLLQERAYKYFSPEFVVANYKDPEGKLAADRNVLVGGALTNRPLFKNLSAIVASDDGSDGNSGTKLIFAEGETMQLDDIRKKPVADLQDDERKFLEEHKAELTDAELTAYGLKAEADKVEEKKEEVAPIEAAPAAAAPAAVAASDATKGKEGDQVTISASELDTLKKGAELGKIAHAELEHKKASDLVETLVADDKFKSGGKDAITNFVLTLNETQRASFEKDVLPNIQTKSVIASEIGSDDKGALSTAAAALDDAAQKIMADDKSVSYATAVKKARDANPQLYKDYEAELKPTNVNGQEA